MSGLNRNERLGEHLGGNGFAGIENESIIASSSPTTIREISEDEINNAYRVGHIGHSVGESLQNGGSIMNANSGDPLATSRQAHTGSVMGQNAPQTNREFQEHSNTGSGTDDMSIHPLLPEDDGMGALRRRIHAIRDLGRTNTEQARMIHDLMTEKYNSSQAFSGSHLSPISSPAPSFRTPERLHTPNRWSGQSFGQPSVSSASTATSELQDVSYNLTAEDLKPTFHPRFETELRVEDAEGADAEEFEGPFLGCSHYKRNVKLQCFDCKKWYTCRFCHDEVETHHLNRPKTENMLCMLCSHAQPAAQYCQRCGETAAQYYCATCKLWDNDASKSIYHCNDCGICRIGKGIGKDFFHCKVNTGGSGR